MNHRSMSAIAFALATGALTAAAGRRFTVGVALATGASTAPARRRFTVGVAGLINAQWKSR